MKRGQLAEVRLKARRERVKTRGGKKGRVNERVKKEGGRESAGQIE